MLLAAISAFGYALCHSTVQKEEFERLIVSSLLFGKKALHGLLTNEEYLIIIDFP